MSKYIYKKSEHIELYIESYICDKCVNENKSIIIEYDGEFMKLTPNDFLLKRKSTRMNVPYDIINFIHYNREISYFNTYQHEKFVFHLYIFEANITKQDSFENELLYKLFTQIHEDWFNLLHDEFKQPYFSNILKSIFDLRKVKGNNIEPKQNQYFDCFCDTISHLRKMIIYSDVKDGLKIKQFSKQIGIISLNASLSTSNSKNMEIWTPFLKRCLQLLNENVIKEIQFVFIGEYSLKVNSFNNIQYFSDINDKEICLI